MRKQGLLKTQQSFVSLGSSNYESETEEMDSNWIYQDDKPKKQSKKEKVEKHSPMEVADKKGKKEEFTYPDDSEDEGGMAQLHKVNKFDNPEINDLILIWEEYRINNVDKEIIMMLCSNQKEFFVYDEAMDESDPDPEATRLLRRVSGGHE